MPPEMMTKVWPIASSSGATANTAIERMLKMLTDERRAVRRSAPRPRSRRSARRGIAMPARRRPRRSRPLSRADGAATMSDTGDSVRMLPGNVRFEFNAVALGCHAGACRHPGHPPKVDMAPWTPAYAEHDGRCGQNAESVRVQNWLTARIVDVVLSMTVKPVPIAVGIDWPVSAACARPRRNSRSRPGAGRSRCRPGRS